MRTTPFRLLARLESLPWDSQHFGFPVARIKGPELAELELRESLHVARRRGVRLVYWAGSADRDIPGSLLDEFGGLLVDRKATFQKSLLSLDLERDDPISRRITQYSGSEPGFALLRLAVAAGACSRFRRDPGIPRESFRRLFELWLIRSIHGELADLVLVAGGESALADPVGLITVSLAHGQGSIGLISVDESVRGRGIGKHLIHAAHRWLAGHGADRALVVTQLDNKAACALYERCGYRQAHLEHFYHFWPQ